MSHHSSELNEMGSAEYRKGMDLLFKTPSTDSLIEAIKNLNVGATGNFPDGKLTEKDEGELQYAFTIYKNRLIMNFGKPVVWVGFEKKQVQDLIDYLTKKIKEL
jgi:hypothetical protein